MNALFFGTKFAWLRPDLSGSTVRHQVTDNTIDIGRAALAAALARAGKRASTAAAVAAMVPLGMAVTAPPAAATVGCVSVCAVGNVTAGTGHFDYAYTISTSPTESQVLRIELPEVRAGEFLTDGGGNFLGSIPLGWTVGQQASSAFGSGAATFKAPNASLPPGAFIELVWVGAEGFLGSGGSLTFTLQSSTATTIAANAEIGTRSNGAFSIDPPTPNVAVAAPEPGSLAVIGTAMAGLAGLRRRKKA